MEKTIYKILYVVFIPKQKKLRNIYPYVIGDDLPSAFNNLQKHH